MVIQVADKEIPRIIEVVQKNFLPDSNFDSIVKLLESFRMDGKIILHTDVLKVEVEVSQEDG